MESPLNSRTVATNDSAACNAFQHRAMATGFTLYLAEVEPEEGWTLAQAVFAEVDRVEAVFSRFQPASEIARINQNASSGPVVTDPEVFGLLMQSRELWERTVGAFDLALGRLSRAWGFSARQPQLPSETERMEAEAASGMRLVELDPEWRTVRFLRPGVELDLGAFAKGYAVDCALGVLGSAGTAGLVDAGHSSIAAVGEPFASGWPVELRAPGSDRELLASVPLRGKALGSSGIMEQFFEHSGRSYPHLLDPRRHVPSAQDAPEAGERLLQVSVLAPTAALADALSTALFVLGPTEGAEALAGFAGCSAAWMLEEAAGVSLKLAHWPT